jgi:NADPH:quinone reductase-like Zn-dependent oxidoreductase
VAFTVDGTGLADVAVARAGLTVPVPAGLDLASATTIPLTWATASGSCVSRTLAPAIWCW